MAIVLINEIPTEVGSGADEIIRLRKELAAAHVDAKRYRKIRSECGFGQHNFSVAISTPYSWELARTGEELDAAIDDAIAKENGK